MKRTALVVLALGVMAGCTAHIQAIPLLTSTTTKTTAPTSVAITSDGSLLWNLEALLRGTFGQSQPFSAATLTRVSPSSAPKNSINGKYVDFNCAGDQCSPLSTYEPYSYTFSDPTDSAFHLSHQSYQQWSFGNYPEPVLINGRIVACNSQESTFLNRYADTSSFTLACLAPVSRG